MKQKEEDVKLDQPPQKDSQSQNFSVASNGPTTNYFGVTTELITEIFDQYERDAGFDQDIRFIDSKYPEPALVKKLHTHVERGISSLDHHEVNMRKIHFGENKLFEEPMPHCCYFVWEGLQDLMIRILICAAIFQTTIGLIPQLQQTSHDWVEGFSIVIAVVVVISVGSITNYSKEKKFRQLNEKNNELVKIVVKRDGVPKKVQEEELLVGDVVQLSYGMCIPADGYLLDGNQIKIDESPLTGESDLIEKDTLERSISQADEEIKLARARDMVPKGKYLVPSPLLLSGTLVAEGEGHFLVLRIGPQSEKGKIQAQIADRHHKKKKTHKEQTDEPQANQAINTINSTEQNLNSKSPQSTTVGKNTITDSVTVGKGSKEVTNSKEESEEKEEEESDDDEKTPLELKLNILADDIGKFGLAAAILTFIALILRFLYFQIFLQLTGENNYNERYHSSTWFQMFMPLEDTGFHFNKNLILDIIKIIILCITVIVVAIPEGLPLAVTLSLAFSIGKMMEDNNLVRKMNACETMGGANFICSDKTGTLTRNEMSVSKFFDCKESHNFEKFTQNKKNEEDPGKYFSKKEYFHLLKLSIMLNIDAEINDIEEIVKASKTDVAFVDLLHNFKEKISVTKPKYIRLSEPLVRIPFTSSRKKMSTIITHKEFSSGNVIFTKGAAEIILDLCKYYINPDTCEQIPFTPEAVKHFNVQIKNFADQALRTICVAYKSVSNSEVKTWKQKDEHGNFLIENEGFCLIGLFGIKDTLRDKVPSAVDDCKSAGIKVIMVTGDNRDTAIAIAKECHILTNDDDPEIAAITGHNFYERIGGMVCDTCDKDLKKCECPRNEVAADQMKKNKLKELGEEPGAKDNTEIELRSERIRDIEKFKEVYKGLRVIARSRPEDKYTMVYGLRECGFVVAVTGDGTNDAPALSKSDVGFAMGIAGTDIAKQAADIIILDDNFASIVGAVKWGRNIYDNIRKFIQFQLTINVAACLLVFICSVIGNDSPIAAIQMLWVNLIMDSFASLALATEPPHQNLLKRKPYKKTEYIINMLMWKHILFQGIFSLILMLLLYGFAHHYVTESNENQLKIAKQLFNCYGVIPGQIGRDEQNLDLIIAGPATHWPATVYKNPDSSFLECGSFFNSDNLDLAHKQFLGHYGSAHLTFIFNTFVIYNLFNQVNARVIDDQFNVLHNLHHNWLFIIITLFEFGMHYVIIQFTGLVFKVSIDGLSLWQWGLSFIIGSFAVFVSIFLKLGPIIWVFDSFITCFKNLWRTRFGCRKKIPHEDERTEIEFLVNTIF